MSLEINASRISNVVTFTVDKNSLKEAMATVTNLKKAFEKLQDPKINFKRFNQNMKQAQKTVEKASKAASKPRDNSQREAERAAKAQARVEAQAAKDAARAAQRRERAELKLLDTASSFKSMQHLTNIELTQAALQASKITKAYAAGTISLQRQNSEIKRLQQSYRRLNAQRKQSASPNYAKVAGNMPGNGIITGSIMGLGSRVLAGAGVGAAAYGAYNWGKDAISSQEERSEIVARARLGNVDYNVLQSLGQFAQANGIDSGIGTQGARKNLDVAKDVSEKLADGALNAKRNKQGEWTGAPTGINTALNMGYTPEQLKEWAKNPFGFVSSYTNTMQSKGLSEQEILHNLEDLGDDLGLYAKAFMNGGKALTDQVDILKRNGQWLDKEQQDQLVAYRKFNQEMSVLSDSQKLAFFEGFMESIDPETMKEFKQAMQDALPFFKGVGKAAGDVVDGLMRLTAWINGKLTLLNGDNTTKEAVSQHYGTTSAPVAPGSNPVANNYGATQPRADGTHEPNMFDTLRGWWYGTSDARDVTSYSSNKDGSYSPVSLLKQSATTTATPTQAPVVAPVVLQNNLPEGMITLNIAPDPSFGNILNATVDQKIAQANQRLVLSIAGGQSSTGG
ncbi:TPA: hypothetical protein L9R01_005252 [Klebsiella pneumoniae]|uniref:hypothetical protein n=1 Tax=Klebsiella pneumoniae complex TaxID=3390273 RepID=UPI001EF8FE0E|nr:MULTISPECIES: hypothetical protein [Klebsiella]ELA2384014.1 hypothetical protein [Klebsiella pneumoniae]MCJ8559083.1 hypothetical protein [Klebsiella quasipneumoniae]MEC5931349.1 hypothetical protein [Klebsiella pneumoniae]ULK32457.1 hypothetical protein HUZ64_04085 [Klebsiella pneumoniae]HBR2910870.1 hypothetical protein [Klebsiella pneumoniae]